jgi:hypothetical protein
MMNKTTENELLGRLEYLAGWWRETKSDDVLRRYQAVLVTLLDMGYREWLDVDAELPKEFMPREYRQLILEAEKDKE